MTERLHRDFTAGAAGDGIHPALYTGNSVIKSPSSGASDILQPGSHYLIAGAALGDPGDVAGLKLPDSATDPNLKAGDAIVCDFIFSGSGYGSVITQGTDGLIGMGATGNFVDVQGDLVRIVFEFIGDGLGVGVWLAKPGGSLDDKRKPTLLYADHTTTVPLDAFTAVAAGSGDVGEELTCDTNLRLVVDGVQQMFDGETLLVRREVGSLRDHHGTYMVIDQGEDAVRPWVLRRTATMTFSRHAPYLIYILRGAHAGKLYGTPSKPGGPAFDFDEVGGGLTPTGLQAPSGTHTGVVGQILQLRGDVGATSTGQFPASPSDGDRFGVDVVDALATANADGHSAPGVVTLDGNGTDIRPAFTLRKQAHGWGARFTYRSAFTAWQMDEQIGMDVVGTLARMQRRHVQTANATPVVAAGYTTQNDSRVYNVVLEAIARIAGTASLHIRREVTVRRTGASALVIDNTYSPVDFQTAGLAAADVTVVDGGSGIISGRLTGVAATTVEWEILEWTVRGVD